MFASSNAVGNASNGSAYQRRLGYTAPAMRIRDPEPFDAGAIVTLVALAVGTQHAAALVRAAIERRELLVAEDGGEVVGCLAYRTDWFRCSFVSVVAVAEH